MLLSSLPQEAPSKNMWFLLKTKKKKVKKRQCRLPLVWAPSSPHQSPTGSLLTWLWCPSNLFLSALGQLDSPIPISSPRFCQQERIKKKEAVVEGLGFGAQGWKAQHITASRQHSSSSTCALILLTWSSYFISFLPFFFPPPLEGYYFCRPLMCSQRKGLYNTKRENQSWKKGHTITCREACLVQLDLLWLQVVILPFQTAVYLKIK